MPRPFPPNTDSPRHVGSGFYGLGDLRSFLALSGAPGDAKHALPWLKSALNPVPHGRRRPDYSFADLVSLFVVRELVRSGVRLRTIRDAESYLRTKWQTERPFVSDEISTDGHGIFVDDNLIAGQIESADRHGQQVMRELVKDHLSAVHYHHGSATYWTPRAGVLVDPRVQFGEPVLEGTRLTTELVAAAASELGVDDAASRLRITRKAVGTAVRFDAELAAAA
jgi:uncharacterized protein (DUF433 family)